MKTIETIEVIDGMTVMHIVKEEGHTKSQMVQTLLKAIVALFDQKSVDYIRINEYIFDAKIISRSWLVHYGPWAYHSDVMKKRIK